jgi:hypothetical protein
VGRFCLTAFPTGQPAKHALTFGSASEFISKLQGIKYRHHNQNMATELPNKQKGRELSRAARTKDGVTQLPRKKFYRQRAHANPFSDHMLE